ncbi:MAG: hypothetical protein IPP48_08270 [Chitinophagaceae bacterium]|nr:hypothetical protein [Chitinophagaceae bacterium]
MLKFYPIILFSLISSFVFAQQNVITVQTGTSSISSNFYSQSRTGSNIYFTSYKIIGSLNQAHSKCGGSLQTAKFANGVYVIKLNTNKQTQQTIKSIMK